MRRLPEPVRGRLAVRNRQPDARHHPRAPGRRRESRRGTRLFPREIRRVDSPRASQVGLQSPRLGRALRGPRAGARARRRRPPSLEPENPSGSAGRRGSGAAGAHTPRDVGNREPMSSAQWIAIAAITVPALAIVLWPLVRGGAGRAAPSNAALDRRLELAEEKAATYRALKELDFDHEAGSLSDDDFQALRDRYEGRAAELITALDSLGEPAPLPAADRLPPAPRSSTRRPAAAVGG